MDQDAYLNACRRLSAALIKQADEDRRSHESSSRDTLGEELAENFRNLDEWLSKGGLLPNQWEK